MDIRTKRIYEPVSEEDGHRVLVDRVWPRGISKEKARIDSWLKELAPSKELRQWFGHDPDKWEEFRKRYFQELAKHREQLDRLAEMARNGPLTLVYSSRETRYNNAVALKSYLESEAG
ncbi:MAG: DUF488 domain-containing protein [Desulfohalobiaceae bacterium]|nr:DUF488 domain-containing protein [Desulfohalobiaceae bacterium]